MTQLFGICLQAAITAASARIAISAKLRVLSKTSRTTTGAIVTVVVAAVVFAGVVAPAAAEPAAGFGALYYNGDVVGTVVPPATAPMQGKDPIYPVTNASQF